MRIHIDNYMQETESGKQVSQFNENALKISRLHNIYLELAINMHNGNFHKSRWLLRTLEAEFKWYAKSLDKKEETNYIEKLNNINIAFNNSSSQEEVYELLLEKEEILREIQQEIGMGSTFKDIEIK